MTTATILSAQIAAFTTFVEGKNRKAAKLGVPAIEFTISEPYLVKVSDERNLITYLEKVDVTVKESSIKINGFSVVGRIDEVEGSNIVAGMGDMSKYINVAMTRCDHCNVQRKRNHLVVVRSEEGEEKIVGATCLQDFVGHTSALQYLSLISWVHDLQEVLDEELGAGSAGTKVYPIESVLAYAAMVIRTSGRYVSKANAEEYNRVSTVDAVRSVMFNPRNTERYTEEDTKTVEAAIEWFNTTEHDMTNTLFHNMNTFISKGYAPAKFFGYVVALLPIWTNSTKKKEEFAASEFIGTVGDKKVELEMTCTNIVQLDSRFGVNYMFIFKSGNDCIKYISTAFDAKVGETYKVTATIKEHALYNGTKQTVITRAKVVA